MALNPNGAAGGKGSSVSASKYAKITPSNTVDLTTPCYTIYVGGTGDINAVTLANTSVIFKSVPVGELHITAKRINASNTTATNLVGYF